ncbi:pantetheine-phosphate adenylyltransferase [Sedimentibacter acidaminivorans]|jgi:pantetheine-phosphate adenylyltransferase|uniref:Phosphopantetheine adenylyltransferase n=1 Tax=Sedimentibacter acidaminivorans TaxID=913099 RepID=A0ABS4GB00_9FIRM|nr:pantetheine-phosphate adenylyltransferase [Sedimentibacter acidaminivorans]MBP1924859.1 pantetheine-phosphate adenylyltransferase [Sedimentibacter acidaminivorans]
MKVLYTGSFDPITCGHLDLIKRCANKFDEVVVTIFNNKSKKHWFTGEERYELVKEAVKDLDNVSVDITEGMVVSYCKKNNINMIVRGLRAVSDYEYELSVSSINRHLDRDLETFFLVASPEYSFISSSIVKEVSEFGGEFRDLVPANVVEAILKKIGR